MGNQGTRTDSPVDEKPPQQARSHYPLIKTIKAVGHDFVALDLLVHASGMAYTTLLSIVPSLAVSFSLVSLFTSANDRNLLMGELQKWILSQLTAGSGEEVNRFLEQFLAKLDIAQIGLTGLAGLLVTLILLLRQIELSLNRIFRVVKPRHIIVRFLYFASSLVLGAVITSLGYKLVKGIGAKSISFLSNNLLSLPGGNHDRLFALLQGSLASFVFFFLVFKFVPNRPVAARAAAMGALITAAFFHLASFAFSFYVAHIANYQVIYGALATLPLFLLWLYVSWLLVLLGGVITWHAEHGPSPQPEA